MLRAISIIIIIVKKLDAYNSVAITNFQGYVTIIYSYVVDSLGSKNKQTASS